MAAAPGEIVQPRHDPGWSDLVLFEDRQRPVVHIAVPERIGGRGLKSPVGLYECGLTRLQVLSLFRLLDWVLALPAPFQYTFKQELLRFEKEKNMPYVTSIERMGRAEGRKEGLTAGRKEGLSEGLKKGRDEEQERSCQTLRELILKRHQQRWGQLEEAARVRLQKVGELARLGELLAELMTASSSEDWKSTF